MDSIREVHRVESLPVGLDIGFYRDIENYVYYQGDINGDGLDDYVLVVNQRYRDLIETRDGIPEDRKRKYLSDVFFFGDDKGIEYADRSTPRKCFTKSGEEIDSHDYFRRSVNVLGEFVLEPKEVGRFDVGLADGFDAKNPPDVLRISVGVFAEDDKTYTRYGLDELTVIEEPFPDRVDSFLSHAKWQVRNTLSDIDNWMQAKGQELKAILKG